MSLEELGNYFAKVKTDGLAANLIADHTCDESCWVKRHGSAASDHI